MKDNKTNYKNQIKYLNEENKQLQEENDEHKKIIKKGQMKEEAIEKKLQKEIENKNQTMCQISSLNSLHSYLSVCAVDIENPKKLLIDIFERIKEIFNVFHLESFQYNFNDHQNLSLMTESIFDLFKVEPQINPETYEALRKELIKFPIDLTEIEGNISNFEIIKSNKMNLIMKMIAHIKSLFDESEKNLEQMRKLVASQHSAVMKLTKNSQSANFDKTKTNDLLPLSIFNTDNRLNSNYSNI